MTPRKPHPKAKAGCRGCERSVSGVCMRHANVSVEGHERRCKGRNLNGDQCRKWALAGDDKCSQHTENLEARNTTKADRSLKTQARRAARASMIEMGNAPKNIDALDEIAELAGEVIVFKDWLRAKMQEAFAGTDPALEEKTLARYLGQIDRTAKILEVLSKQGNAERELKLREELVGVVTGLFNSVLASYIPAESQPAAQAALAQAVGALEPPRALTAGAA